MNFDSPIEATLGLGRWTGYSYGECLGAYAELDIEPPSLKDFNPGFFEDREWFYPELDSLDGISSGGDFFNTDDSELIWDSGFRDEGVLTRHGWWRLILHKNKKGELFCRMQDRLNPGETPYTQLRDTEVHFYFGYDTRKLLQKYGATAQRIMEWVPDAYCEAENRPPD